MSKIVRSVGKAISAVGKVVSGVAKFVTNTVKSITKTPIVRGVLIAAAAYLTAGAALGAAGAFSAGGSLLTGAASGLGSAWGGLTSLVTGGGLSALSTGLSSAYGAGVGQVGFEVASTAIAQGGSIASTGAVATPIQMSTTPAASATTSATTNAATNTANTAAMTASRAAAPTTTMATAPTATAATGAAQAATTTVPKGILGSVLDVVKTPGGGLLAATGLKLTGGLLADAMAARERQNELDRINRNQNVSGINTDFGPAPQPGFVRSGIVSVPQPNPVNIVANQPPQAWSAFLQTPDMLRQQQTGIFGAQFGF